MLASEANTDDLDLSDDKNINDGGDSSDDDAENSTNQRDNNKEELDLSRLENLLLYYSADELTEHHNGNDGSLAQPINMKQEATNPVWMETEKAYLSGRLCCAALLELALSTPLDYELILMALLSMLRSIRSLERSISGSESMTHQRTEAVQH